MANWHESELARAAVANVKLFAAAERGDIQALKAALSEGAAVDATQGGETALHVAARHGHVDLVGVLLDAGAPIDALANLTPIATAAAEKHSEVVRLLADRGADLELKGEYGETALENAAMRGLPELSTWLLARGAQPKRALARAVQNDHLEVARALLTHGAPVDSDSGYGQTALEVAVASRSRACAELLLTHGATADRAVAATRTPEMLALLLAHGAAEPSLHVRARAGLVENIVGDVDAVHDDGHTPLMFAAEGGHEAAIQALLAAGADPHKRTEYRDPPIVLAAGNGHAAAVRALLPFHEGEQALLDAALASIYSEDHHEAAALLLAHGATKAVDEGSADDRGVTALMRAAGAGDLDAVADLIASGAKLDQKDVEGDAALGWAAREAHLDVVQALLAAGAKPGGAHLRAASSGHAELALSLIDAGAAIDARDESRETALMKAADRGDHTLVVALLDRGADVNLTNILDHSALMLAAQSGHYACVQTLIAAGAKVRTEGHYGAENALSKAIERGQEAIAVLLIAHGADVGPTEGGLKSLSEAAERGAMSLVRALVEAGATPTAKQEYRDSALQVAARKGHVAVVRYFLDLGVSPDFGESPPILGAAERGHHEVVALLAERGATIDADRLLIAAAEGGNLDTLELAVERGASLQAQHYGGTPLHTAATNGHLVLVRRLVELGADMHHEHDGKTPMAAAEDRRLHEVVSYFVSQGCRRSDPRLVAAAVAGDGATLLSLLDANVHPDSLGPDGRTALMEAASGGHGELVALLLARGARPNLVDADGWTALMEAADFGDAAMMAQLLDAAAEPFVADHGGFTAYRIANEAGHATVVSLLEERGADRDRRDDLLEAITAGSTKRVKALLTQGVPLAPKDRHNHPLAAAAQKGNAKVMQLLVQAGADIEANVYYGRTALGHAAAAGHASTVQVLIDAGANLEATDEDSLTALFHAVGSRRLPVVKLLMAAGASLEAKNNENKTPLAYALEYNPAAAKLLLQAGAKLDLRVDGSVEMAKAALKKGIDVQFEDYDLALHAAVWQDGGPQLVEALLAQGADANALNEHGQTPLLLAAYRNNPKAAVLLLPKTLDPTPAIHLAAEYGELAVLRALAGAGASLRGCLARLRPDDIKPAIIRLCLEHGDDVDAKHNGKTALDAAAAAGDLKIVKALLKAGAAPGKALLAAAEANRFDVAELFLRADTSPDQRNDDGWSVAMFCARHGNGDWLEKVVARGVDTGGCLLAAASSGKVALIRRCMQLDDDFQQELNHWNVGMHAAASGNGKALALVWEHGAPSTGTLFAAASTGKVAIAEMCRERGAEIDWRDQTGTTALMNAAMADEQKMLAWLLANGADVDAADEDGWTALHFAAQNQDERIIDTLVSAGANKALKDGDGKLACERYSGWDKRIHKLLKP